MPIDPKEDDYEDFVAACLIGLGYFIETNLHLRAGTTEVLELDIVATPVDDPLEGRVLLDAKSGKSGFADIFKMSGWMNYLESITVRIVDLMCSGSRGQHSITLVSWESI